MMLLALLWAGAGAAPVAVGEAAVCQATERAPAQQRMSSERRAARQHAFIERVPRDASAPTLRELLDARSSFSADDYSASRPAPITIVLNLWNRRTLCRQIEALRAQSVPVAHVWVCAFGSPLAQEASEVLLRYNDSRIEIVRTDHNLKYYGRFQLAITAPTRYTLVIDDDMLPGVRFVELLLRVASSARHALLGSIGWMLPRPQPRRRFASYRSLTNRTGGLYVPDLAYDLAVDR